MKSKQLWGVHASVYLPLFCMVCFHVQLPGTHFFQELQMTILAGICRQCFQDQNQIKSARSSVFSSTWLHGYLHSAPWSRGITLLDSAIILISSLDSKMILRYLKQVPKASSAKYRSNMCSIAVVQVSVQWLHLRTWHLLSSAHNDLNRKARRRHLLQRPELCAAWLLSPLQTHIVSHLHRITYSRKSGPWV